MRKNRMTVEELVEYLAVGYPKDIFYSDIYRVVESEKMHNGAFQEVVNGLRFKGIWVHS